MESQQLPEQLNGDLQNHGTNSTRLRFLKIKAEEMDLRLKALAAFAEEPDLVPTTHKAVYNCVLTLSRGSYALF